MFEQKSCLDDSILLFGTMMIKFYIIYIYYWDEEEKKKLQINFKLSIVAFEKF